MDQVLHEAATRCHDRVKKELNGVWELGRRAISSSLVSSNDPFSTIADLQSRFSLGYEQHTRPALDFLEVFTLSRSSSYHHVFQMIKGELETMVGTLDENSLMLLLKETIYFMGVDELKSVPRMIIKKLGHGVPSGYLNYLHIRV